MSNTLNVLHLPNRMDRAASFKKEFEQQGITDYKVWDGMIVPQLPFKGISMSMKRIVRDARDNKLSKCIICEDDIYFMAKGAWQFYLENTPTEYDIYFGTVYDSDIDENNRIVSGLAGLTLYTVHESFYDTFLGLNEMNNLDREIGKLAYKYKYFVCPQFVAHQTDGWSDHKRGNATYGHLIKGRKLFGVG